MRSFDFRRLAVVGLICWLTLTGTSLRAEWRPELTYQFRWGRGEQADQEYNYFENYVGFNSAWRAWQLFAELELSRPPEFGYSFTGVRRFQLTYNGEQYSLTLGHLAQTFGRGVGLNLYEERVLDFDNQPVGLRWQWHASDRWDATLLVGRKTSYRFYSPASAYRLPDGQGSYDLAALENGWSLAGGLGRVAPYLIWSRYESPIRSYTLDWRQGLVPDTLAQKAFFLGGGVSVDVSGANWYSSLEISYGVKRLQPPYARVVLQDTATNAGSGRVLWFFPGKAEREVAGLYGRWEWFPGNWEAAIAYHRYGWGPQDAEELRDPLRQSDKAFPWQAGPTGVSQPDISLLANVTHPTNDGEEVGLELSLERQLGAFWHWRNHLAVVSGLFDWRHTAQVTSGLAGSWWPLLHPAYNPYLEASTELEWLSDALQYRLLAGYNRNVLSGSVSAEITNYYTLVPAYLSWHLSPVWVLGNVTELQLARRWFQPYGAESSDRTEFRSWHQIVSVDWRQEWSFALVYDYTSDNSFRDAEGRPRHRWLSGELTWHRGARWRLGLSYGSEKGGVRCTGGVCRLLNPFDGWRLNGELRW